MGALGPGPPLGYKISLSAPQCPELPADQHFMMFHSSGPCTANVPTLLCFICTITVHAQEMHGNRCKDGDSLQHVSDALCSAASQAQTGFLQDGTAHTPSPHNSVNHGFFSYAGSLFLLGSFSVKKQPLLGKTALLVLPCPGSQHTLRNDILNCCAKTTGLLFYLRGHFIVADPKSVSRSQNEWDFKSCSHSIVL